MSENKLDCAGLFMSSANFFAAAENNGRHLLTYPLLTWRRTVVFQSWVFQSLLRKIQRKDLLKYLNSYSVL